MLYSSIRWYPNTTEEGVSNQLKVSRTRVGVHEALNPIGFIPGRVIHVKARKQGTELIDGRYSGGVASSGGSNETGCLGPVF